MPEQPDIASSWSSSCGLYPSSNLPRCSSTAAYFRTTVSDGLRIVDRQKLQYGDVRREQWVMAHRCPPANLSSPSADMQASAAASAETREPPTGSHFVYVVRCANGTLYAGYTTNVDRRVATHNAGRGARYTRGLLPVELLAAWAFETKRAALRAERLVKRLSRDKKLALIMATTEDPGSISRGEQSGVLARWPT